MIGNKFLSVAGASEPTDAQFNYVTMLLHGDGTNGAQNNTFVDSSTNNFTITRNGNTTQGSFSPYGSNWSNYFDGTGDYLTVPANSVYAFGTGNFTIEAWIYRTSDAAGVIDCVLTNRTSGFANGQWGLYAYSNLIEFDYRTAATANNPLSASLSYNTWTHIAVVRNGTSYSLYKDGTLAQTTTISASEDIGSAAYNVAIGAATDGSFTFAGNISNIRVNKGTAVYTGAFTPPTLAPLATSGASSAACYTSTTNINTSFAASTTSLLICQSNRFVDNSNNTFTITKNGDTSIQRFSPLSPTSVYSASTIGGSGYFDGTGDYLSVPDNAALDLSTGDFTIECWAYPLTGISDLDGLISKRNQSTFSGSDWRIAYRTASTAFGIATGSNGTDRLTPAIKLNCWSHIAFVRSSGTLKCYANGILGDSLAWTENLDNAESLLVGLNVAGYDFPGYITDVRINKGTAIYTGAFTPPSLAPLATSGASSAACYPSTTNVNTSFAASTTSLLTSMTNGAIYDNAMMNDLETLGNAQISTSVKKYGTGSLAFDGTGDYLSVRASPNFAFGTGDFTIECWIYVSSNPAQYTCIMSNWSGSDPAWLLDFSNGSGNIRFNDSGAAYLTSSSALPTGQWNHVAVSRSGTSLKMFFNGSTVASTTNSTSFGSASSGVFIGAYYNNTYPLNGYIDDLRITKGFARYTVDFPTPTAALPDKGT